ncbi:hypothetical protein Bca4012_032010 [Brassica carinata]
MMAFNRRNPQHRHPYNVPTFFIILVFGTQKVGESLWFWLIRRYVIFTESVLGGNSGVLEGKSGGCIPWLLKLMTNELYQLAAVAFCLLLTWFSDKLWLSLELFSFAAGVMISTRDLDKHTLGK